MPRYSKIRVSLRTRGGLNTFTFRAGRLFKLGLQERLDALYEATLDNPSHYAVGKRMSETILELISRLTAIAETGQWCATVYPDQTLHFLRDVLSYVVEIER